MYKKFFFSLLWVGALCAVSLQSTPSSSRSTLRGTFQGLRVGVEGMIVQSETRMKLWVNGTASDNLTVSGWNLAGGVRGDIGRFVNNVYLGFNLEWAAGMGTHTAKCAEETPSGTNYKIQQRYMAAGALKVGGLWQECTLYYAKAGITKAKWDIKTFYDTNHTFRNEKNNWGVILGAGVEHVLSDRWTVGLDLDHQRYSTASFQDPTGAYRWKANPASNRILLSFNYKLA